MEEEYDYWVTIPGVNPNGGYFYTMDENIAKHIAEYAKGVGSHIRRVLIEKIHNVL